MPLSLWVSACFHRKSVAVKIASWKWKNIQEYVLWTMHSKTGWKWVLVLDVSIYQGVSEEAGLWHNGLGETRGWDWGCPHFPPISLLLRRQWWPIQELEVVPKCATKEQFKAQRVALTSHQYRRHWEEANALTTNIIAIDTTAMANALTHSRSSGRR